MEFTRTIVAVALKRADLALLPPAARAAETAFKKAAATAARLTSRRNKLADAVSTELADVEVEQLPAARAASPTYATFQQADAVAPYGLTTPLLVSIRECWQRSGLYAKPVVFNEYACTIGEWPQAEAGAYGAMACAGPEYYDYPELAIDYAVRSRLAGGGRVSRYADNPNEADRAGDAAVAYAKEEEAYA